MIPIHQNTIMNNTKQAALLSSSLLSTPSMATQKLEIQLLRSEGGEKKRCHQIREMQM